METVLQFFRAIIDLLWTFVPVIVVASVMALFGEFQLFFNRSDLILIAAVIFTEGWLRARNIDNPFFHRVSLNTLEITGVIGALATVFLATIAILSESGKISALSNAEFSERLIVVQKWAIIVAIIYGTLVRFVLLRVDEISNRIERESPSLIIQDHEQRIITRFLEDLPAGADISEEINKLDDFSALIKYGYSKKMIQSWSPLMAALASTIERENLHKFFNAYNIEWNRRQFDGLLKYDDKEELGLLEDRSKRINVDCTINPVTSSANEENQAS